MMMFDLQGKNLYLIGMMGSGKSTLGKSIAEKLDYGFIDTDTEVEKAQGKSIPEIFEIDGKDKFRQIETQVLDRISDDNRLVVATGGGIVIELENWNYLKQGLVVWLDVSIAVLVERLKNDFTRPILNTPGELEPKLQQILSERRDRYKKANLHILITEHLPPNEIVRQIMNQITN
jgi:shikimate kinase